MQVVRRKRILFIGHEASLSGAPILLFNLLKLVADANNIQPIVAIRRYGPFLDEYKKNFQVLVLKGENYSTEKRVLPRLAQIIKNRAKIGRLIYEAMRSDVIFSN